MSEPNLEVLFLVISVLILCSAVIYWLWSQIQINHKKTILIEAAVIDIQTMLARGFAVCGGEGAGQEVQETGQEMQEVRDLEEVQEVRDLEEVQEVRDLDEGTGQEVREVNYVFGGVMGSEGEQDWEPDAPDAPEDLAKDLQLHSLPEDPEVSEQPITLQQPAIATQQSPEAPSSSLDGMGLRDLRRLAEKRGVSGFAELKKKELIQALKQMVDQNEIQTLE